MCWALKVRTISRFFFSFVSARGCSSNRCNAHLPAHSTKKCTYYIYISSRMVPGLSRRQTVLPYVPRRNFKKPHLPPTTHVSTKKSWHYVSYLVCITYFWWNWDPMFRLRTRNSVIGLEKNSAWWCLINDPTITVTVLYLFWWKKYASDILMLLFRVYICMHRKTSRLVLDGVWLTTHHRGSIVYTYILL